MNSDRTPGMRQALEKLHININVCNTGRIIKIYVARRQTEAKQSVARLVTSSEAVHGRGLALCSGASVCTIASSNNTDVKSKIVWYFHPQGTRR
jgi:hypothetical protein